ncbi:MIPEP [Symbiodinium necroappetens]|uniref:MIPEP protein n=1 Tax=Symbiodinium necroappetens TaxID=1628268 RepID=A0A812S846_9DINO|nr:MIPEP [Symbiodinium necroappetens]
MLEGEFCCVLAFGWSRRDLFICQAGKLYCPCRCAGSIKWIHEECLQAWLRSKDGKTACELCGHSFDFVPVYSKNAPQRLTVSDWVGAFCSSSYRVGHRVLRVLYAVGLWGFLLPILTIMATRSIFGRQPRPAFGSAWHVLALTFDILIGECLSVAGIAFIYLLSFLTAVRSSLPADAASSQSEGAAPALVDVQLQPVPGEETTTDSHESTVSVGIQVDTRQRQEEVDPEEDLLNIMGLQGNPVRSLLSMLTFLCANVAGIYTFLGLPSYLGRWTLARVLPWIQAVAPDIVMLISWSSGDESSRSRGARSSVELPSAGVNVILDLLAFLFGYGVLACCMIVFVLGLLLVGAVTGCGQNSRSWQACRTLVVAARSHLCESILQTWQRIQRIAVALLQLVAFPAYVGHLVLCLLAGPVLHLSQQGRASLMSANPFITFVMQLFIGYVHLWGFAFMEGCVANVLMPDVVQRASLNFFVSAINCHRRLFGTMTEELGLSEATPLPPHWATLKLSLIHVAVHTPLVFAVWYLPAFLLDRLVGEALFPMLLVDQTGDVIEGLHRRDPFSLSGPVGVPARPSSKAKNGGMAEGQSLFVLELMQLYVLVLQCIRILETSPVMTRLISSGLRCWLRAIGFGHLLVGESPAPSQVQSEADWSNWVAKPWKFLGVSGLVVVICWSVMALVLALPLATGRLIVGLILSSQAKRFSDFLPLSMGVVVASAWILVTVKLGEALPRILEQASALRRHRCLHILACRVNGAAAALNFLRRAEDCLQPYRSGSRAFFFKSKSEGPLLGIQGLDSAEDFPVLAADVVKQSRQKLDGLAACGPLETVSLLDDVSNGLCQIADAAELIRNVHPDEAYSVNGSAAVQEIAGYMSEVNLDTKVYNCMKNSENSKGVETMPLEASNVLRHMRVSMEHEGIHLAEAEKQACMQMLDAEQQLSFDIVHRQEQVRQQVSAETEGAWLSVSALDSLNLHQWRLKRQSARGGEEVHIPRDTFLADRILKTVPCGETRQRMHQAQQSRDTTGEEMMLQLLSVRQQLAKIRGYDTWAHYAQREALFEGPEKVQEFLETAWDALRPGFLTELQLLAEEKQSIGLGDSLEPWDVPFLLRRCKQRHREADEISEYLSYGSLMKGVELVLSRLLGLAFVQEAPDPGEVWHPSVQKFALREKERTIGILYLDPFPRAGKKVQSAQFTLQGSKALPDGQLQVPKTCLVYALPPGSQSLSTSFAVTFMHEIGHAVHSLLSETRFQHLSGTRGTIDFVEFPSHLFEHFVLDPDCLSMYASHASTGSKLPENLRAAHRSRPFGHFEAVQQLVYALVDQAFYSFQPSASSDLQSHLHGRLASFEQGLDGPCNASLLELLGLSTATARFDHLVHYGGSYYCYLFNRALSAHVWHRSFRPDPFNRETGERLHSLLRGGSVVQTLGVIRDLCPGDPAYAAHEVPLDAMMAETIVLPLGLGTLLLRLMLPLKVQSVFQVPIIFLLTDCWSLGLVLTKVIWRLVQSDVILHNLHREIEAVWEEAQGSLTHLFFNLRAHWRLWRMLVFPMLEAVVFHLVLPRTAVLTLLQFMEPGHEYLKAALLMYCYHIALTLRITLSAFPRMRLWLGEVRQQIFDSKYLISTELQNYHRIEDLSDSQEDAAGDSPGLPGTS